MSVSSTLKLFDNFSSPLRKVFDSLDKVLVSFESLDKVSNKIDLTSPIQAARTEIGVFNQTLDEMGKKLNQNTESSSSLFDSFKKIGSVTAMLAGAKETISQNLSFDDAKRQALAISGELERSMDLNKFTTMFATHGYTKTDIAKGYQSTAGAGWDVTQSTIAMPTLKKLTIATGDELNNVIDMLSNSMAPLGIEFNELADLADKVAITANVSNADVKNVLESYQGGAFKGIQTANMSIPELNSVIGVLANAGITGAESGTQIRNIINGLYSTETKVLDTLSAMNLSAYNDDGSAKNGFDLLQEFGAKLGQYDDISRKQIMTNMFNVYDEVGVNAIMNQIDKLEEYRVAIEQSNGALDQMVNTLEGGIGGTMRNMKSEFSTWMIGIGQSFEPLLYIAAMITQTDMFGGLLIGLQMLIGTLSTVAFMFSWLLNVLDFFSPVLTTLIMLKLGLIAAHKLDSLVNNKEKDALIQLIWMKLTQLGIEKKSLSTLLTAIPANIKKLIIDIAAISPLLAIIIVIGTVILVLGILMQKFDGLRRAVVWVVNSIIDMINGLLDKLANIPIIGDHITKSRLTKLDEDTAFKFKNPFDNMLPELPELPEEPELPEFPETPDLLNIGDVGTVGKVKSVEGEIDISDEDIKLMRDVAMKEALVQYNTFSLSNSNSFGDIRETADVNSLISKITEMIEEGVAVSTELSYNYTSK